MTTQQQQMIMYAGAVALLVVAVLAVYKMQQRRRVDHIKQKVMEYLTQRFRTQPAELNIDCSNDANWPILVRFSSPTTGHWQRMQFAYSNKNSTLSMLSDSEGAG
jgi:hypothetical protein